MLEKVLGKTTIPTSTTGWSATDWRNCCSGDPGSSGRGGGGGSAEEGHHHFGTVVDREGE